MNVGTHPAARVGTAARIGNGPRAFAQIHGKRSGLTRNGADFVAFKFALEAAHNVDVNRPHGDFDIHAARGVKIVRLKFLARPIDPVISMNPRVLRRVKLARRIRDADPRCGGAASRV